MKPSFSIEIMLIFVVIYYLVYINQGYIFHQIVSKPKIYLWLNKGDNKKKYLELQKSFDKYGAVQRYFDSFEENKIHKHITPNFDEAVYLKKYDENQFNPNLFGKKDSLPYIINMFTTPRTLLGNWIGY